MDDSLALDSEPSHAVIAHSSPPLPSSPSNAPFNLVGLPYELQRKIILDAWYAAIQLGDTSDWLAMLGVKAFECIVAPDHWAELRLWGHEGTAQLDALADALPHYGALVKELYLFNDDGSSFTPVDSYRLQAPVARVLAGLPNLSKLCFIGEFAYTIALSPHLDSLTYLMYGRELKAPRTRACSLAVIRLVASCPNLVDLELSCLPLSSTDAPLLTAAIASRRRMSKLNLFAGEYVIDESAAGVDWICPLADLTLYDYSSTCLMSLSTLQTFLPHFTRTLVRLDIVIHFKESFLRPSILTPFPLPHLTHLQIEWYFKASSFPSHVYDLPTLFDLSPIEVATIEIGERPKIEDSLAHAMAQRFIYTHRHTLATIGIHLNDPTSRTLTARALEADAQRLGIELSPLTAKDWGYDDSDFEEEEQPDYSDEEEEDSDSDDDEQSPPGERYDGDDEKDDEMEEVELESGDDS